MPFEFEPSKLRITLPLAGQISEIDAAGAAGVSLAALRDADDDAEAVPGDALDDAPAPLLRDEPVLAVAVPAGGATRNTWPTSIESGFVRLFQRVMLCTDVRLLRAIFDSVSPRSTR